ncbi:MAG: ATPase [Rhizobiales bacterium]|nr:ATPase [Hyphomicrobiales bacterium]MBN9008831.1 ATPase [Hyphomicrobiales bacterium]
MTGEEPDPVSTAQRLARPELPKRFYALATAEPVGEGGFALKLDGRGARTPARKPLAVKDKAVAEAIAAEWNAVGERIDPGAMPLTKLVNSAIDRVAAEMDAVRADIVAYAGTDAILYRADGPESLVSAEDAAWNPLLAWAREALGARFILAGGITHVRQDEGALAAIAEAVKPLDSLELAALHVVTTLTGSAIIALALARGRLTADEAWAAAHVDEDWQARHWGEDDMAMQRRAARRAEFDAAALVLKGGG